MKTGICGTGRMGSAIAARRADDAAVADGWAAHDGIAQAAWRCRTCAGI